MVKYFRSMTHTEIKQLFTSNEIRLRLTIYFLYIQATCALVQPWEGFIIGFVGSFVANGSVILLNKLKVDDPVGKYCPASQE